jgi:hypothetical protein
MPRTFAPNLKEGSRSEILADYPFHPTLLSRKNQRIRRGGL